MIEVEALQKRYRTAVAVKHVSFSVRAGEVVGMLGPNGAGKTTTLRMLAGFISPTAGTVRISSPSGDGTKDVRTLIGYMPETLPLYPEMRVDEYLSFRASLKRVPRRKRRGAVQRAMTRAGVDDVSGVLIGHLSKGYRQRVGLADALVSNPPLLILDEPTSGLDPNQIREVRRLIRTLGKEHTVLLSTHILSEVEATCDRALVIDRGSVIAEGSIEQLRSLSRSRGARLTLADRGAEAVRIVTRLSGIRAAAIESEGPKREPGYSVGHQSVRLELDSECDPGAVLQGAVTALVQGGLGVREAVLVRPSLDEVFEQLTRTELATERAGASVGTHSDEEART